MKFPKYLMSKTFTARGLLMLAGLFLMVAIVPAQKVPSANPAGSLEQCRNGRADSPNDCSDAAGGGQGWVTGNAGASDSHWAENDFLPYRDTMINLVPTTSYTITIGYDILKSGKHAVDYLGTYNASYANTFPCNSVSSTACTGVNPAPSSTFLIPQDTVTVTNNTNPNTGLPIVQQPGNFSMWGGTITNVQYENYLGGDHRAITVTFTANESTVVLAWGGHVGWIGDWGAGNSASAVSGSPYHGSQDACSFGCGAQDRSLAVAAVAPTGAVLIQKEVLVFDCSDYAPNKTFNFSASANFGTTAFTLQDLNPGTSPCSGPHTFTPGAAVSEAITSFGTGNTITVTEGSPSPGYTLSNVNCVESGLQNSTHNQPGPSATIVVEAFETVTCTFTNTSLQVTAAPVSITGRVTTDAGAGIRGLTLTLVDASTGQIRGTTTNSFGYYTFYDLPTDDFYVLTLNSTKRYRFSSEQRSFTLT